MKDECVPYCTRKCQHGKCTAPEIDVTLPSVVDFPSELYKRVSSAANNTSFVISPRSVQTCLGVVYAAASGGTAAEIVHGLRLDTRTLVIDHLGMPAPEDTVHMANRIYVKRENVQDSFVALVKEKFLASVEQLDFRDAAASVDTINTWVRQETKGQIEKIVDPSAVTSDTEMIVLNVAQFEGTWLHKFPPLRTKVLPFWTNATTNTLVQYMRIRGHYKVERNDAMKATVIEIPYTKANLSMFVILPDEYDGLRETEQKLTSLDFTNMVTEFVELSLPKFHLAFTSSLKNILQTMGIQKMFSNGEFGHLWENATMTSRVSDVVQKTIIRVDESGTIAATATAINFMAASAPPPATVFNANRPFLFYVREKQLVQFMGRFMGPQEKYYFL